MDKRLQAALGQKGILLHRGSADDEVRDLIQRLRPVTTQHALMLLGPRTDGGYLVPDVLDGLVACFSPGVADNSAFEVACMDRGMRVFMADRSVDGPNLPPDVDGYSFVKKFIGCVDDEDFMTVETWMAESDVGEGDLLLQMDIEGAEYTAILSIPKSQLSRFRVIVVEFHDLDKMWDPQFLTFVKATFDKLLEGHVPVHIHPNPSGGVDSRRGIDIPRVLEISFLRRDVATVSGPAAEFPHHLDHDYGDEVSLPLPPLWYGDSPARAR